MRYLVISSVILLLLYLGYKFIELGADEYRKIEDARERDGHKISSGYRWDVRK